MQVEEPYFMNNPKWYRFNESEFRYELTDAAPTKAIESYNEYYDLLEESINGIDKNTNNR